MASAASVSSSTTLFHRPLGSASPQCVRFPSLPPQKHNRFRCLVSLFPQQKVATNIAAAAMASDDLPVLIVEEVEVKEVEVDSPLPPPSEITATQSSSDPDILKAIEDVWENLEDSMSVEKYPDNPMLGRRNVVDGKAGEYVWITYKNVYDIVMKLGNSLRSCDIGQGARCGIYGANSFEWVMSMEIWSMNEKARGGWRWRTVQWRKSLMTKAVATTEIANRKRLIGATTDGFLTFKKQSDPGMSPPSLLLTGGSRASHSATKLSHRLQFPSGNALERHLGCCGIGLGWFLYLWTLSPRQLKFMRLPKKFGLVGSSNMVNGLAKPFEPATPTPPMQDFSSLNTYYAPHGYPSAYYYQGYDGSVNDWSDYRYMNRDLVDAQSVSSTFLYVCQILMLLMFVALWSLCNAFFFVSVVFILGHCEMIHHPST